MSFIYLLVTWTSLFFEKWDLSYTIQENSGQSYSFCWKKGLIIYLAALKKGAIRHAYPYCDIYMKLTSPSPPRFPPPHPLPPIFYFQINQNENFSVPIPVLMATK